MTENKKKHYHRGPKKKRKGSVISNIILVIAIVVFIISGVKLYQIFSEYQKGKSEYDKVQKLAVTKKDKKDKEDGEDKFTIDFDALVAMNPDIAGWIRFEEPSEINYPVVQGKDNAEYLRRTFQENDNKLGTLFVDVDNKKDFSDKNTFIYGHNMKNGTMFAQLMKYQEEDYYKEHPYFYIYTPNKKVAKYQICSAGIVGDTSISYQKTYESEQAYLTYLEEIKKASAYDTKVTLSATSQLVSLSTCTNVREEDRFLVHGVKISEEDQ
ncbi:MAG: class B sortase [Lachnospiraceae bacterium]